MIGTKTSHWSYNIQSKRPGSSKENAPAVQLAPKIGQRKSQSNLKTLISKKSTEGDRSVERS